MPKIAFSGDVPVAHEEIERNIALARASGLPFIPRDAPAIAAPLAVVGGGPSVVDHIEEIRSFGEHIWAINGVCGWLRDQHDIDSVLLGIDPHVIMAMWAPGAKRAILGVRTTPAVFEILKDADVRLFELVNDIPDGIRAGCSTATATFHIAIEMGYRKVVYFGCEGSYQEKTHAYPEPSEVREYRFVVECGGKEYLTAPDFYVQSIDMAQTIKNCGQFFEERSGGLLRALIENDDHDITKVSRAMLATLTGLSDDTKRRMLEAA